WTVLGREGTGIATGAPAGVSVEVLADMKSLVQRLDAGDPPPQLVVLDCAHYRTGAGGHPAQETELADGGIEGTIDAAHEHTKDVLEVLQHWLAEERLSDSHLVVVTRDAVAVEGQAPVSGLAQGSIWTGVRAARRRSPALWPASSLSSRCARVSYSRPRSPVCPRGPLRQARAPPSTPGISIRAAQS